jgi:hypothetical protein
MESQSLYFRFFNWFFGIVVHAMTLKAGTDDKLSFVQGIEDLGSGVEVR